MRPINYQSNIFLFQVLEVGSSVLMLQYSKFKVQRWLNPGSDKLCLTSGLRRAGYSCYNYYCFKTQRPLLDFDICLAVSDDKIQISLSLQIASCWMQ